jgi:hypothetical protein
MGKNQDPGSEIDIPDPQHCIIVSFIAAGYGSRRAKLTRIHGDHDLQHCNVRVGMVQYRIPVYSV